MYTMCLTLCNPMDCSLPGSWGFSRQEYWNGLPCPPSGYFPNPGMEPRSPALQSDSLPAELPGIHHHNLFIHSSVDGHSGFFCPKGD